MTSVLTVSVGQSVPRVCQKRKPKYCTGVTVTGAKQSFGPDVRVGGLI